MSVRYKVHPAIGICRVGNSSDFFIGPETPGHPGLEIDGDGEEHPIQNHKSAGRIKRQAARFRVFEYDVDAGGRESLRREVPGSQLEWRVQLTNRKAANNQLAVRIDNNRRVLVPDGPPRNSSILNRESLVIRSGEVAIAGESQGPISLDRGRFLGTPVLLGELLTDSTGRLIVVGGKGIAEGVPDTPGGPLPPLSSFADNDRWYDDVSDGPINASVSQDDGSVIEAVPSWLICGPPDFAPAAQAPVTLHDIVTAAAIQRGWLTLPSLPSFMSHVLPILKRSLTMRWVHDWPSWNAITNDWKGLADMGNIAGRDRAYRAITETSLHDYALPSHLLEILTRWRDGAYVNDYAEETESPEIGTSSDRAALDACIATSFFPGIEAGFIFGTPLLYSEPGRFSHVQVEPGQLTAQMALPWQADFNDCRDDWWPSQRPNDVFALPHHVPGFPVEWQQGVGGSGNAQNRLDMVENFWKLGFLKEDNDGNLTEAERDSSLPSRPT